MKKIIKIWGRFTITSMIVVANLSYANNCTPVGTNNNLFMCPIGTTMTCTDASLSANYLACNSSSKSPILYGCHDQNYNLYNWQEVNGQYSCLEGKKQ